jgi:hypothetical protein
MTKSCPVDEQICPCRIGKSGVKCGGKIEQGGEGGVGRELKLVVSAREEMRRLRVFGGARVRE